MKVLALSFRYLWSRPLTALLNLLLLSLGLASITFVLLVTEQVSRSFERDLAKELIACATDVADGQELRRECGRGTFGRGSLVDRDRVAIDRIVLPAARFGARSAVGRAVRRSVVIRRPASDEACAGHGEYKSDKHGLALGSRRSGAGGLPRAIVGRAPL